MLGRSFLRHILNGFQNKVPLQIGQTPYRLLIGMLLQKFAFLPDQGHRIDAQVIFL